MTFHISQALLIERTIVVSVTIVLFGLISIGGLWLWRRQIEKRAFSNSQRDTLIGGAPEALARSEELARAIERIRIALRDSQVISETVRETLVQSPRR